MQYQKRPWSMEERHVLKKYYNKIPIEELLEKLPGRTESSVRSQVSYLRARKWSFN